MAGLEPSAVARTGDGIDGDSESIASTKAAGNRLGAWRRTMGLLMIAVVVLLWTTSNFLASAVLADHTYSKPYFLTYLNTSFFILPMLPVLALRTYHQPDELSQWRNEINDWATRRFASVKRKHKDSLGSHGRQHSASGSRQSLLGASIRVDQTASDKGNGRAIGQLTLSETMKLSFEFCLLWFLSNYFIALALELTTVASTTILTSTAGVFTLIFGVLAGVEKFTLRKLTGVLASLAGVILISSVDFSGKTSDDEHRGKFPKKSFGEITAGDSLALLSAVGYGAYSVFMKKRIADESAVNMPIFFGFVGLINVLLLWPGFFILHWTGLEQFELPPTSRVTSIILTNAVASCVADLAWAYAVLLTSPIVVTLGLSMTIPLSLVGQMILNSQTASVLYWVGAFVVVLAFVFVNHEEKKDVQQYHLEDSGILAHDSLRSDHD